LGGAETLLVVEDNEDLCEVLAQLLELRGYRVYRALDGEAGLSVFLQHQAEIGLVILDVMLPRMGGFELFRRMREVNSKLPVIFSSGFTGDAREALPGDVARAPLVRKPYKMEEIYTLVREQLKPARLPAAVK
jgi:DNA-binding response OmpR family regulator